MDHIYEPLKSKHSIRLIKLLGRTKEGLVSCTLEQYEIERAPAYRALSYYWGSPAPTDEISLGSQRAVLVHKNLWHFLDQMILDGHLGYYWTDALCIDQKSVEEKNHQVGYMGEIYQHAREVVMWLGRESRVQDSMQILVEHVARKTRHTCYRHRDLVDLLKVPYWNRLWIVQEVSLARSILVVCGPLSLTKSHFITALNLCSGNLYVYHRDPWPELLANRAEQEEPAMGPPATVPQILRLLNLGYERQPLWRLISQYSRAICSDPRDKVFGLLGLYSLQYSLSMQAEASPLVVDYSKDLHDVFWDAVLDCPPPEEELEGFIRSLVLNMAIPENTILSTFADRTTQRCGVQKDRLDEIFVLHIVKAVAVARKYLKVELLGFEKYWRVRCPSHLSAGIALTAIYDLPFDTVLCDWQPTWLRRSHRHFDKHLRRILGSNLAGQGMADSMTHSPFHGSCLGEKDILECATICSRCGCRCIRGNCRPLGIDDEYECALPETQARLRLFRSLKANSNDGGKWRIEINTSEEFTTFMKRLPSDLREPGKKRLRSFCV